MIKGIWLHTLEELLTYFCLIQSFLSTFPPMFETPQNTCLYGGISGLFWSFHSDILTTIGDTKFIKICGTTYTTNIMFEKKKF